MRRWLCGLLSLAAAGFISAARAQPAAGPPEEVDVALVLAVDVSFSMDLDELALQRNGYIEAFRSKQLHDANHKYGEEHARVEKLLGEADLTQKNLRRALEQIKELQQEMERVSQALHSKERELESVQAALLRALADKETRGEASAADGERHHVVVASPSPRQSMSPQRQEKVRVSFTFNEFGKYLCVQRYVCFSSVGLTRRCVRWNRRCTEGQRARRECNEACQPSSTRPYH